VAEEILHVLNGRDASVASIVDGNGPRSVNF